MFQTVFVDPQCSHTYIIANSYMQLVVMTTEPKQQNLTSKQVLTPTILEALFYFHALCYVRNKHKKEDFYLTVLNKAGMRIVLATQTVVETWKALIDAINNSRMTGTVLPYLFKIFGDEQFSVLGRRENGLSFDTNRYQFSTNDKAATTVNSVFENFKNRSPVTDSALRLFTTFMLNYLPNSLCRFELYGLAYNDVRVQARIAHCNCSKNKLLLVCTSLRKAICDCLGGQLFVRDDIPVVTLDSERLVVAEMN